MYSHIFILSLLSCIFPSKLQTTATSSSQDFTFAQPQSFLRVEPEWPLTAVREVAFHFRTEKPHGLLLYHGLTDLPEKNYTHYEMYLMLENARLKIIHVYDQDGLFDTYTVGKGLNQDKWHKVRLKINPTTAELLVYVDNININVSLPSLKAHPNYNLINYNTDSYLYFGGTDPYNPIPNRQYNYVRFIGCLGNITFGHQNSTMESIIIQSFSQTEETCIDRCWNEDNCLHGGKCVNHYKYTDCDCFGTGHEGPICQNDSLTTITLRGYSYLTYRVYYWRDRVQSEVNMLSIVFRTFVANSVLLYGAGEHPEYNYIAISISEGDLYFEIDFGDGPLNTTLGYLLHDEVWHNVTMIHHGRNIKVILDNRYTSLLEASDKYHHLHLDPEIYIGGAPENAKGLLSHLKFVGCLKEFYFNRKNVLFSLHKGDSALRHYGVFPIETGCSVVDIIPITFRLPEARLLLSWNGADFDLNFEYKTTQRECTLASGYVENEHGKGLWEIYLIRGTAYFEIMSKINDTEYKRWSIIKGNHLSNGNWHYIDIKFKNGSTKVELNVDFRHDVTAEYPDYIKFTPEFVIGSSIQNLTKGFVGCIRDISVNEMWIDPRALVGTNYAKGKVSLDNCQLINPCNNPQACEHGGKCLVKNGDTVCDCKDTGYTGKTCHFSIYKRTCEELYLIGHRISGLYKTDIDRNGPLPPASVYCDMNEGYIITRVKSNMGGEMIIRKHGYGGFYFNITYREFTPPMLQSLIQHSKQCKQLVKYDCHKMPLGLRTYTWMQSSSGHYVTTLGSNLPSGTCPCSQNRGCKNASLMCNCDSEFSRWLSDSSFFTDPKDLAIIRVYVLQPPNKDSDAEARLTIGSLDCVETDTQQYVITFKTPVSSVEVPGWYRGDLAFSFRTTNSKAVLVYQAAVHTEHGYFRVLLTNEAELSFEFTVNGKPQSMKVKSTRQLNTGEWQQVWVDHDTHHMRFTVNSDYEMIDLAEDEEAGPFEGPLYVGGVPKHHVGDSTIKEGFIGCFRGLVINDDVVNLHEHLIKSSVDIVVNCQPSCSSNPCKNGATCLEYWGSYECKCANPVAHSGTQCENNINTNAMTFLVSSSYFHNKTVPDEYVTSSVLEKDILLNFRTYVEEALLLYANDHLNNFVQLHFEEGKYVYFTFNSDRTVVQGRVEAAKIPSGKPIQIKLSRGKDKTTLLVNGKETTINKPMKFVKEYYQDPWKEGRELEKVRPPRGHFPTIPHGEMFLGSVGMGTISNLTGFVGCMQGLKIGDEIFDLDKAALDATGSRGKLRPGCRVLCDEKPCQHGGECFDDWKKNLTICDCSLTSYTGHTCQKDIGGKFNGIAIAVFSFNLHGTAPDTVNIRIAFSTKETNNMHQTLLFVQIAQSKKYILVALTSKGSLQIEENRGHDIVRRIIEKSGGFADGRRHWLYYNRNMNNIKLIVDKEQYIPTFEIDITSNKMFSNVTSKIFIGHVKDHRFPDYGNFTGCMSSLIVDLGGLNMRPLDALFGYQTKETMEKVFSVGLVEDRCPGFSYDITTLTTMPGVPSKGTETTIPPVTVPFETVFIESEAQRLLAITKSSGQIGLVLAVFFFLVMFGLSIYIWKLQKKHKKRQLRAEMLFYQGRRNTGASKAMNYSGTDRYGEYSPEIQPLTSTNTNKVKEKPKIHDTKVINFDKPVATSEKLPLLDNNYTPQVITENPPTSPTKEVSNHSDSPLLPLKASSSQELEWDPAADNTELITAMNEMNPGEMDNESDAEEIENPGPLRSQILKNAPLASASEVTINRLSQTFN